MPIFEDDLQSEWEQLSSSAFEYFRIIAIPLCKVFSRRRIAAKFDLTFDKIFRNGVRFVILNCLKSVLRSSSMFEIVICYFAVVEWLGILGEYEELRKREW